MTAQPWAGLTPGTMYYHTKKHPKHGMWAERAFAFSSALLVLRTRPGIGWDIEVQLWTERGMTDARLRHPCKMRRAEGFDISDWCISASPRDEVCGLYHRAEGEEVRLSLGVRGGWLYLGRDGHGNGNLYIFESPQDLRFGVRTHHGCAALNWPGPFDGPLSMRQARPSELPLGKHHPNHPDL